MLRSILATLILSFAFQANAFITIDTAYFAGEIQKQAKAQAIGPLGLDWVVGETANYNLKMGPFPPGTMVMEVASENDRGFWMNQNVEILGQKQLIEVLLDKETGEILEMRQNGEPADIPDSGDSEVVEQREESITVPAGTYDCIYIKMKDAEGTESEAWINPFEVPIVGLLKQEAPSQVGKVVIELTSFKDL